MPRRVFRRHEHMVPISAQTWNHVLMSFVLVLLVVQEVNSVSLLLEVPDSIHVTEHLRIPVIRLDTAHCNFGNKTRVNSAEIILTQMVLHPVIQSAGQVVNTNQLKPVLGPAFLELDEHLVIVDTHDAVNSDVFTKILGPESSCLPGVNSSARKRSTRTQHHALVAD